MTRCQLPLDFATNPRGQAQKARDIRQRINRINENLGQNDAQIVGLSMICGLQDESRLQLLQAGPQVAEGLKSRNSRDRFLAHGRFMSRQKLLSGCAKPFFGGAKFRRNRSFLAKEGGFWGPYT